MKLSTKSARSLAAQILAAVIFEKQSLTPTLSFFLKEYATDQQSFIKELCFGSLRWYFRLSAILKHLLAKSPKDNLVYCLLLIGIYQLLYLNVAEHAAVNETVNAAKELKKDWASKLINAVLRNFLRQRSDILAKIDQQQEAHYAHPGWLIRKLHVSWPQDWQSILNNNNEHPPLSLRVNLGKVSYNDYLKLLNNSSIEFHSNHLLNCDVTLKQAMDVGKIPGFTQGLISVQDAGAQVAAGLLDLQPQQRILDACAAPGGKTTHILELEPNLKELIAIDSDRARLNKVQENLDRLHLKATLIAENANRINDWWDKILFDRILLDAPCSATGVIRRHPDIKVLRQESDIRNFTEQQKNLLNNLWPLLEPGGLLLYATCSILPDENEKIIEQFLLQHSNAREKEITVPNGIKRDYGWQLLPSFQCDGFFYCLLFKISSG